MSTSPLSLAEATARLTVPGQMFETERVVVRDVELTVWKNAPRDLRHVLDASLNYGSRDFLVYEQRRVSFERHYRLAATVARRLADLGVRKGDRVSIAARNSPEWVMAFWGIVAAGAVAVPLNAWWTTDELAYGLEDSGTSVLFVDDERLERVRGRLGDLTSLNSVVVFDEDGVAATSSAPSNGTRLLTFTELVGDVAADAAPPALDASPDDDATMFYTSGTTGRPKGAVGTHRNAATNLMNLFFRGQVAALRSATEDAARAPSANPHSILLSVPLFHATGCLATMMSSTLAGSSLVMMHHFDAGRALRVIESERITAFGGVPTVVMQILDHPDFARVDTSSVVSVTYGGAPAPPDLVRRIRAAFPGSQAGNGYGLTETSAGVCFNIGVDYVSRPDSCGPVVPVCEAAIVPEGFEGLEPPHDRPRGPHALGELWIKGPSVVRGYWKRPDVTATTFTRGWLHTGDIARIDDDGFVYIVDRAKDMIIRGGENVYSVIVEAAIFEHPDVSDCAVVGVPHATLGEEVAAVVILRAGRVVEAEEISRHVALRLARFEVPTKVIFRSGALPRNPQGKVLKRQLRDELVTARDAG